MIKRCLIIFAVAINMLFIWQDAAAEKIDPFLDLKRQLDLKDSTLRDGKLSMEDMSDWWQIIEQFTLNLFNVVLDDQSPLDYFKKNESNPPEGMTISTSRERGASIYYKYCCGPHCAPHEMSLRIYPLKEGIYFIEYGKNWWDYPDCEGPQSGGGKSIILKKNTKSGQFEITARFEESNFYRDLVLTGKLGEIVGIEGNPYGSAGDLETKYDPVTSVNGEIRFNTKLLNCMPGGPSCHRMYLYWTYDNNKKLRCLYYLDRYELIKDPLTGAYRPTGKRVELNP